MPKHSPTPEQGAIIDAIASPGPSLMVKAGAGTAKSSTIEMAAPHVRVPALALAFNRNIAAELKGRLPDNFQVKTFNGLGHGAWMRANPQVTSWQLEPKKLGKLVSQVAKEARVQLSSDQWDSVRQLVSQARQQGIVLGEQASPAGALTDDTPQVWQDMALEGLIPEDEQELSIELARQVLATSCQLARAGQIDFDDQIYASACLGGRFPQFPFMAVDEAQDLNPLNHRQVQLSARPEGRVAVVGDPRQAIYAFRGADSRSMDTMRGLKAQWQDRKLTLTFRCPRAIVARQLEHYPEYRAAEGNAEGLFHRIEAPSDGAQALGEWEGWGWADVQRALLATGKGAPLPAILCRNNAPLLSMAFKLIRQGVGVNMLGRDLGKGLVKLSRQIAKEDGLPADVVRGLVQEWAASEISKALANDREELVAGITDRSECLLAVLESAEVADAGGLRKALERLFASEGIVALGTGHRAKGLEYDLVLHLDPWRLPSRFAKIAARQGDTRQLQQEYNLLYVIETRTKHTLIEANLEDFHS